MKKIKQSLCAAVTGVLLFSAILAGCSGGGGGETGMTAASAEAQGAENAATASAGGAGSEEEAIVLTAVVKDMSADDPASLAFLEAVSKGVSESYGREIKLELVPISDGTYSESMGLLLQSGVIPDLMYFQGGDYQFAITQGILEDLTPYMMLRPM